MLLVLKQPLYIFSYPFAPPPAPLGDSFPRSSVHFLLCCLEQSPGWVGRQGSLLGAQEARGKSLSQEAISHLSVMQNPAVGSGRASLGLSACDACACVRVLGQGGVRLRGNRWPRARGLPLQPCVPEVSRLPGRAGFRACLFGPCHRESHP